MKEATSEQPENFLPKPAQELRILATYLPAPIASYTFADVDIDVYQAKHIHTALWADTTLMHLSQEARKSYRRYGNVGLTDEYDAKAAIYVVSARYQQSSSLEALVQEWLTVRFIPFAGTPLGYEDFSICRSEFGPLDKVIQKHLFAGNPEYHDHLASIAGVSAIRPYFLDPKIISESAQKNRYTALSFMLANKVFLQDADSQPIDYFTAIVHGQIVRKALSIPSVGGFPIFTPAHHALGFQPGHVRIDRNVWSYKAPGYFLNIIELLEALVKLTASGMLDMRAVSPHMDLDSQLKAVRGGGHASHDAIRSLSSLLTVEGPLPYSALTGAELRAILDQEVSDAAQLTIMERTAWNDGLERAVNLLAQPLRTGSVDVQHV